MATPQWKLGLPFKLKEAAFTVRKKLGHKTLNELAKTAVEEYLTKNGVDIEEFDTSNQTLSRGEINLLKTLLEKAERPQPVTHWQPLNFTTLALYNSPHSPML